MPSPDLHSRWLMKCRRGGLPKLREGVAYDGSEIRDPELYELQHPLRTLYGYLNVIDKCLAETGRFRTTKDTRNQIVPRPKVQRYIDIMEYLFILTNEGLEFIEKYSKFENPESIRQLVRQYIDELDELVSTNFGLIRMIIPNHRPFEIAYFRLLYGPTKVQRLRPFTAKELVPFPLKDYYDVIPVGIVEKRNMDTEAPYSSQIVLSELTGTKFDVDFPSGKVSGFGMEYYVPTEVTIPREEDIPSIVQLLQLD